MSYDGFLEYGGNEIVNTPRAVVLSRALPYRPGWIVDDREPSSLDLALGEDFEDPTTAPWFDPAATDVSLRFFGLRGVDFQHLYEPNREVQITEGLRDGGEFGRARRGPIELRVTAFALALGTDALAHGLSWLDAALSPGACGQHGNSCGTVDARFFTAAPPAPLPLPEEGEPEESEEEYAARVVEYERFLHETAVTSGPIIVEEFESGGIHGRLLEFTITAGRPHVYGATRGRNLPTAGGATVVQDIPYNLVKYPSAEITPSTPMEVVRVNYVMNPSLESNTSGWLANASAVSGSAPGSFVTGIRVSDISANGSYAYRARLAPDTAGTAASGVAALRASYIAPSIASMPSGAMLTASAWVALQRTSDSSYSTPTKLEMIFQWLDANELPIGSERSVEISSSDYSGSVPVIEVGGRPYNAQSFEVRFEATVPWRKTVGNASQTADIRLFVDALALVA